MRQSTGNEGERDLHEALAHKDFVLIDVHTPYAKVIPGTDARAVLTCLDGPMSVTASDALVARGYRAIRHLVGGMNAWTAARYSLAEF